MHFLTFLYDSGQVWFRVGQAQNNRREEVLKWLVHNNTLYIQIHLFGEGGFLSC